MSGNDGDEHFENRDVNGEPIESLEDRVQRMMKEQSPPPIFEKLAIFVMGILVTALVAFLAIIIVWLARVLWGL